MSAEQLEKLLQTLTLLNLFVRLTGWEKLKNDQTTVTQVGSFRREIAK
jgi:hypothetical protein